MSPELPSTVQLAEAPELAALHLLDVALATAERSLTAPHPNLDELADAILVHLTALEVALHRYRTHLRARTRQSSPTDF